MEVTCTTYTAVLRLEPDREQFKALMSLMVLYNKVANDTAQIAKIHNTNGSVELHHAAYYSNKANYPELPSQSNSDLIRQVARNIKSLKTRAKNLQDKIDYLKEHDKFINPKRYKQLEKIQQAVPHYKPTSSISLSWDNSYRIYLDKRSISILSTKSIGRQRIHYTACKYYRNLLESMTRHGEAKLVYNPKKHRFYLHVTGDVPSIPYDFENMNVMGVDQGCNNLLTSDNNFNYNGDKVWKIVKRHQAYRSKYQQAADNGSKTAKRRLRESSGQLGRFMRDMCHVVSKELIKHAIDNNISTIALEKLTYMKDFPYVNDETRRILYRWPQAQLAEYIQYKAVYNGIMVIYVNPKYTSITCSKCGYMDKSARITRDTFRCPTCGDMDADVNAARNIRRLGYLIAAKIRLRYKLHAAQSTS